MSDSLKEKIYSKDIIWREFKILSIFILIIICSFIFFITLHFQGIDIKKFALEHQNVKYFFTVFYLISLYEIYRIASALNRNEVAWILFCFMFPPMFNIALPYFFILSIYYLLKLKTIEKIKVLKK